MQVYKESLDSEQERFQQSDFYVKKLWVVSCKLRVVGRGLYVACGEL